MTTDYVYKRRKRRQALKDRETYEPTRNDLVTLLGALGVIIWQFVITLIVWALFFS